MDAKSSSEPADYIREIKSPPDWSIIYETEPASLRKEEVKPSKYSLLEDFEDKKFRGLKAKLDDTQLAAVELALKEKVALIQVTSYLRNIVLKPRISSAND